MKVLPSLRNTYTGAYGISSDKLFSQLRRPYSGIELGIFNPKLVTLTARHLNRSATGPYYMHKNHKNQIIVLQKLNNSRYVCRAKDIIKRFLNILGRAILALNLGKKSWIWKMYPCPHLQCCKSFERLTATQVFLNTPLKQESGETYFQENSKQIFAKYLMPGM